MLTSPQSPPAMLSPAPWVRRLKRAVTAARETEEAEPVHQIRVATRRLITWMDLGGARGTREDLRRLRNRMAARRDLDVLLERPLPPQIETWARSRWAVEHAALQTALAEPAVVALLEALAALSPFPRALAAARLGPLARKALRRGKVLRREDPGAEGLHDLRRAVRPVRYALEWLEAPSPAIRALQDELGLIGDAAEAGAALDAWGGSAPELRAALSSQRRGALWRARFRWPEARAALRGLREGLPATPSALE